MLSGLFLCNFSCDIRYKYLFLVSKIKTYNAKCFLLDILDFFESAEDSQISKIHPVYIKANMCPTCAFEF